MWAASLHAQSKPGAGGATTAVAQVSTSDPLNVSGQVVDAISGQPIPRVLVQMGDRATLAGLDGHFAFSGLNPAAAWIMAIKPGFSFRVGANEPQQMNLTQAQLAAPIVLRMYAEGIVKGVATSPGGEPLANLTINLLRYSSDNAAGVRWMASGFARTNSRGEFRIPAPAGQYRLQSGFERRASADEGGAGEAVLPEILPPAGASVSASSLHLGSGQQLSADLHPAVVPVADVVVRDDSVQPGGLNSLQVIPADGPAFLAPLSGGRGQTGEQHLTLPVGTWTIRARRGRSDDLEQGSITVTADGGAQIQTLVLHTLPAASLPVEVLVDQSTANGTSAAQQAMPTAPPDTRALGLRLEPVGSTASLEQAAVYPVSEGGGAAIFSVPPGTWRLRAQSSFLWYARAASYGGTDLMLHDVTIAAGAAAFAPILLTVSSETASVSGMVTLNGQPAACTVLFVAAFPTLQPVVSARSRADGTLGAIRLPPGTWRAIAFEHQPPLDPTEAGALDPWSTRLVSVAADAAQAATVTLEAVPDSELPQ